MIHQLLATKRHMLQAWTKSGLRVPVTVLVADDCTVIGKATKDGYILVGSNVKKLKNVNKPQRSQLEKAGLSVGFRQMREIRADKDSSELQAGTKISPASVLSVGDIVKVTGTSKGTGFTGVVKRHGFKGGPRTHGQDDRERAPGSIGAGTTPGRVYKNKRMAGRSGNAQVTVENLQVVAINSVTGEVWVKGLVPGAMNGMVLVTKVKAQEFEGLLGMKTEESTVEEVEEPVTPLAETKTSVTEEVLAPEEPKA